MKINAGFVALGIVPLMAACVSQRVVLAPVGPSPAPELRASNAPGQLRVFSQREPVTAGDDPVYYQHTDYRIYDHRGKLVKYVGNTTGHFGRAPRVISLPPGDYTVKARAKDYLSVVVPVIIESGQTTSVHLDDRWSYPTNSSRNEFVFEPNGAPVGWSAQTMGGTGD